MCLTVNYLPRDQRDYHQMIEHDGAELRLIEDDASGPGVFVHVTLRYSLFYDGQVIPGRWVEIVPIRHRGAVEVIRRKAEKRARKKLEAYFDGTGQSDDGIFENIFCDSSPPMPQEALSEHEELSLENELKQIELEFVG